VFFCLFGHFHAKCGTAWQYADRKLGEVNRSAKQKSHMQIRSLALTTGPAEVLCRYKKLGK